MQRCKYYEGKISNLGLNAYSKCQQFNIIAYKYKYIRTHALCVHEIIGMNLNSKLLQFGMAQFRDKISPNQSIKVNLPIRRERNQR